MNTKLKYLPLFLVGLFANVSAQEIKAERKKEIKKEQKISYILDYPENAKGKVPLMVFLHGSGERGDALELVKANSPFTYNN